MLDAAAITVRATGDIIEPINEHVIDQHHIQAEWAERCASRHSGRQNDDMMLFKSVGTVLEDLVAAKLAYQLLKDSQGA